MSRPGRWRCATTAFGLAAAVALAACGPETGGGKPSTGGGAAAASGGVLRLVGKSDVDHLATTSAYYTTTAMLMRAFTRQLINYPLDSDFDRQIVLAPDLATAVPSLANGGISADGKTYTFHLRSGVRWNTQPPRAVVAGDEVRGIQLLCNPVSPVGAPGYYETTVTGMQEFCDAFAKTPGTVADIQRFIATHPIRGVRAPDDTTVVFTLRQPASDFLNIVAMPFASPVPIEYLAYLPDGPDFRAHTISDGPYRITRYVPNREIELDRNPVWTAALDPLRKAYVDSIQIIEGVSSESGQQQLQAGTADMSWDQQPPTADRAQLLAAKDPDLILGPPGDHDANDIFMPINFLSPSGDGALRKLAVRQALEYAVDRAAVAQIQGGAAIARPSRQAVVSAASGYVEEYDPYPSPGDHGDPAKAKALLAQAGYPNGITLKLLYRTGGLDPDIAQTIQASLLRAGVTVQLVPATGADFFAKYLQNPDVAKRGVWDLALPAWVPDWFGNNGRSFLQALYDGRTYGPNSADYGDYNSAAVNQLVDRALGAATPAAAEPFWRAAAAQVMQDAAVVPVTQSKIVIYHSARLNGCVFSVISFNCDMTMVWLAGASSPGGAP
ncbi:MAG TPA: ABC transporter substrate-binding protein [Gemmatimonadaceae bacterium]|nr:ABC transporter substrate-binding protein [Gemmatimonadaceae bacterium]